jgi:hypothetical protein
VKSPTVLTARQQKSVQRFGRLIGRSEKDVLSLVCKSMDMVTEASGDNLPPQHAALILARSLSSIVGDSIHASGNAMVATHGGVINNVHPTHTFMDVQGLVDSLVRGKPVPPGAVLPVEIRD